MRGNDVTASEQEVVGSFQSLCYCIYDVSQGTRLIKNIAVEMTHVQQWPLAKKDKRSDGHWLTEIRCRNDHWLRKKANQM